MLPLVTSESSLLKSPLEEETLQVKPGSVPRAALTRPEVVSIFRSSKDFTVPVKEPLVELISAFFTEASEV